MSFSVGIGPRIENMLELPAILAKHNDVYTVNMERLRDAYGASRLGIHVRKGIEDDLAKMGLGHYPATLPDSQADFIRLYRKGTPAGNLIEAVLTVGPKQDDQIRMVTTGEDVEILRKIRELVCP